MKRSTKIAVSIATSVAVFSIGSGVANAGTPGAPVTKGNNSWTQTSKPNSSTLGWPISVTAPTPPMAPLPPIAPKLPASYQPPTKPTAVTISPRPLPCASKSSSPIVPSPPSLPVQLSKLIVTIPQTGQPLSYTKLKPTTEAATGAPPSISNNAPIAAPAKQWPMVVAGAPAQGSLARTGSDTGVLTEIALTLLTTGLVLLIVTASKPRNNVIFTSPEITASTE